MRQELVRAHQRATTTNSGHHTSPVSVCAVLLERMLPRADALGEDRPTTENTSALYVHQNNIYSPAEVFENP